MKKWIAIGIIALLAIGVGVYHITHRIPPPLTEEEIETLEDVRMALLGTSPLGNGRHSDAAALEIWRAASAQQPDNEGLRHLARVIELFDFPNDPDYMLQPYEIVRTGWQEPNETVALALQANREAVDELLAAIRSSDFTVPNDLPITYCIREAFIHLGMEARWREHSGNLQGAVEGVLEMLRLAEIMGADGSDYSRIDAGRRWMTFYAVHIVNSLLRNPDLSEGDVTRLAQELQRVALDRSYVDAACAISLQPFLDWLDSIENDLEAQRDYLLIFETETFVEHAIYAQNVTTTFLGSEDHLAYCAALFRSGLRGAFARIPEIREEYPLVVSRLRANSNLPALEREYITQQWFRDNVSPELRLLWSTCFPFFIAGPYYFWAGNVANHFDVALSRTRLALALCALRLNEDATAFLDPFTEEPLHISDERIWSVGPDLEDQGGMILYNTTNGTTSAGDLVLER